MQNTQPSIPDWIRALFADIDRDGVEGMWDALHEDVRFRFGSFPPGRGREQFASVWGQMSPILEGMEHRLSEAWEIGSTAICRGEVTYRPRDGAPVTLPFCNVFKRHEGRISEYSIYIDASAVFGVPPVA